jgi:pyridoxamine 5'-phosphate oxidase
MVSERRVADDMMALRVRYEAPGLGESSVAESPLQQFDRWFEDAVAAGVPEPNTIALATCAEDGPSVRCVLAKSVAADGIRFFTNTESHKARQIAANPSVAATFAWITQHRQILFRGSAARLSSAEVAAYFAGRPRGAQIGAWASRQSEVIESRDTLRQDAAVASRRFEDQSVPIPVPAHWGGYLIRATSVEFWQGQPSRLHDRLRFSATDPNDPPPLDTAEGWVLERLSP